MKTLINKYINMRFGLGVCLAFLLASCGEDENVLKGTEPSHRVVYTSQMFNDNTINVNSHIDFADVSQGIISREWVFPAEANVTLSGKTSDPQLTAFFTTPGEFEIGLNQTFKNPAFAERDTVATSNTLDTLITVIVLPRVVISSIKVNILEGETLGAEINLSAATPTEISFGKTVRFTYTATGDPTAVVGDLDDAVLIKHDAENDFFDVQYGVLNKVFGIDALLQRNEPLSYDTISFSNFVKAIPSTDPVTIDGIFERSGNIYVDFSRGIDESTLKGSDFAIELTTKAGGTLNPSIASATVSDDDNSLAVLILDGDQMFDDDAGKITFTSGKLRSLDAYLIDDFTDHTIDHETVNFFEESNFDWSFEKDGLVNWLHNDIPEYSWWQGSLSQNFTAARSSVQVHEGSTSLKVSVDANQGNVGIFSKNADGTRHTYDIPQGITAKISVWIYVEAPLAGNGNTHLKMRLPEVEMGWGEHGPAGFFNNQPVGEWFQFEDIISTNNKTDAGATVCVNPVNFDNNALTFYIDDMVLQEWNARP
ncbi:MAG: hypothetical protein ABJG41_13615 [Cyclobacteriaceae bacterium]